MRTSKTARQERILQIIEDEEICSLSCLQEAMSKEGINVDASTLCRDISHLRIGKLDGRYQPPDRLDTTTRILPSKEITFRQFVVSYEAVGNMVIIRTLPGSANAIAIQLDARQDELDCAGTIAGDDTVFALHRSKEAARRSVGWLDDITGAP